MTSYRVFVGAPPAADLRAHKLDQETVYQWDTVSSEQFTPHVVTTGPITSHDRIQGSTGDNLHRQNTIRTSDSLTYSIRRHLGSPSIGGTQSVVFPIATLEAASRRISLLYKNIIFDDSADEGKYEGVGNDREDQTSAVQDQTTLITWPPTVHEDLTRSLNAEINGEDNITVSSFLLDISKSHTYSNVYPPTRLETQAETQETQSYNYSDASSIVHFPSFHFALHSLTSLSSLSKTSSNGSRKVNMLLAVLELEGPDTIRIKKGADAGREVFVLKLILGDEEGCVCKLTAWREVAEAWGGVGEAVGVKRGDVLYFDSVTVNWDPSTSPTLTASPYLKSRAEICYRTMPYTHEDNRLRPDLRLGDSDAAVRKVAAVAHWFEGLAGLI